MSSPEHRRRASNAPAPTTGVIPKAPPLPAPRPLQRAKDAAYRFIGYPAPRPASGHDELLKDRFARGAGRLMSLGATQDATTSHRTGLEINTLAINESGTHALIGGKEIFKTVRFEDGVCVEDLNLRTAIRSKPTQASGVPRQVYAIDIADVAWARGDCGDYVAAATSSGKIILYDLGHAGLQAAQLHEHFRQVHKVTFNPHSGNYLLSGSQDGTVRLWDVRDARNQASTLQSKRKYSGQSDGVRDVKWSPTDAFDFAFGTDSGEVQRWDIRNFKTAKIKVPAHGRACNVVDWHPDGKHLASAGLDQTVRIWDMSVSRQKKASWEIKTPYPVLNARWRPSCEASISSYSGQRQCTQIATAYDREHPFIHIWDTRRPALPYREIAPFPSAPTDLLWHSQDLLWTVGREGIFLQTDIQHTAKVIDRRNLQSFAVSPEGEVNFVVQKRTQRRSPKLKLTASADSNDHADTSFSGSKDFTTRSYLDDGLDHSFLSVRQAKTHKHTSSGTKTISTPTGLPSVMPLDEILHERKAFSPQQQAARGMIPYHADSAVFKTIADSFGGALPSPSRLDDAYLKQVAEAFDKNIATAESMRNEREAQTWRLVKTATMMHLNDRARHTCSPPLSTDSGAQVQANQGPSDMAHGGQARPCSHNLEEHRPFTLVEMLQEMLRSCSDNAQLSAKLVSMLVPLLPAHHALSPAEQQRTEASYRDALASNSFLDVETNQIIEQYILPSMRRGMQPLQIEAILLTYHEQLLMHKLFVPAARLRQLAYPAYPAVYEDFMTDNHVYVKCGDCGKAMESGMAKMRCETCRQKQAPCPYCLEASSPFGMGRLLATCGHCNHTMHAGCSAEWFSKEKGEGCLVEGCVCNCGGYVHQARAQRCESKAASKQTASFPAYRGCEPRREQDRWGSGARQDDKHDHLRHHSTKD